MDELSPPAPDMALAGEHGDENGDRVETPDPLEPVVEYLRRANPALYGALSTEEARTLTILELGSASLSDADLALLMDLPALEHVVMGAGDLSAPNRRRILGFEVGRMHARRVTTTMEVGNLQFEAK